MYNWISFDIHTRVGPWKHEQNQANGVFSTHKCFIMPPSSPSLPLSTPFWKDKSSSIDYCPSSRFYLSGVIELSFFLPCFFHEARFFWDSCKLHVQIIHSFSGLRRSCYTGVSRSVSSLTGWWLGRLFPVLIITNKDINAQKLVWHMLDYSWYIGMEWLDHGQCMFSFLRNCQTVSKEVITLSFSLAMYGFQFLPNSPTFGMVSPILAILMQTYWCLIAVLCFIVLIINDAETYLHMFICHPYVRDIIPVHISYPFLIRLFAFLLNFIKHGYKSFVIYVACKYFFQSVTCLFILLIVSFEEHKGLGLMKSNLLLSFPLRIRLLVFYLKYICLSQAFF